jgi:hypothetical protein
MIGASLPHLIVLGLAVWGCWGAWHHIVVAVDHWGNAAPDLKPTLDRLNRPCKGMAGPDDCGTLAQINKTAIDAGDAIVRTEIVERSTAPHITAAMDTLNDSAQKLGGTADILSGTATALTGTENAATDTLAEGKRTIAGFQPLITAYTTTGNDLDAVIKDNEPNLHLTLTHFAGMSASGDLMLADAQWKTHQFLHPDKIKLGFWGMAWAGLREIHKLEPPIF